MATNRSRRPTFAGLLSVCALGFAQIALAVAANAADSANAAAAARAYRTSAEAEILSEFSDLLTIPNLAATPDGLRKNAEWISRALQRRGITTRLLEHPGAPPVVYGERRAPNATAATRTVVFYAHYDGQPVEPENWTFGDPFRPVLTDRALDAGGTQIHFPKPGEQVAPEARIYGRSAGDDKAPILGLMAALDALDRAKIAPSIHLKFFFEGEEEEGSPHLAEILTAHKELLEADLWLFCDGPVHQSRKPQVVFGVRGVVGFELSIFGPKKELHSGHYGNWAPNPAIELAQLLATMKDREGRVLIPDFELGVEPLTENERQALAKLPELDAQLRSELWLGRTERPEERLDQLLLRPSLNVNGLASAGVGKLARNVVPSRATASIDLRLVKGLDPTVMVDRVAAFIRAQGYHVVDGTEEPSAEVRTAHPRVAWIRRTGGYRAVRTSMEHPLARQVIRAAEAAHGSMLLVPSLGGSLPLFAFEDVLKTPLVIVPIANHDDNQHTHDENLRLQNLWDGIETYAALMTM